MPWRTPDRVSAPTLTSSSAEDQSRGRRIALSVVLWLYGISITIFLFSIWGRAVAADTQLLTGAAEKAADSALVSSQVEVWFDSLLTGVGLGGGDLSSAIVALPEVEEATARLAGELVESAADATDPMVIVDVAEIYRPTVPAVSQTLSDAGLPIGEAEVAEVVGRLRPLVIARESPRPMVGPESDTARSLTIATLMALGAMVLTGTAAFFLSRDRRAMFRSLLNRLAVSGFTYFVFFQVSSWVLNPRGGRASVRGGVSDLIGAKLWIPLTVAVVAGSAGWAVRHRRHVSAVSRPR